MSDNLNLTGGKSELAKNGIKVFRSQRKIGTAKSQEIIFCDQKFDTDILVDGITFTLFQNIETSDLVKLAGVDVEYQNEVDYFRKFSELLISTLIPPVKRGVFLDISVDLTCYMKRFLYLIKRNRIASMLINFETNFAESILIYKGQKICIKLVIDIVPELSKENLGNIFLYYR